MSYKIMRFYARYDAPETVATGLTLAEVRAHCKDPESSSNTATTAEARARTAAHGPWFDGYGEEK